MRLLISQLRWETVIYTLTQGCFSGISPNEIVVLRNSFLELFRRKPNGKLFSFTSINMGSPVFDISSFSLEKEGLDFLFLLDFLGRAVIIGFKNSEKFNILSFKTLKSLNSKEKFEGLFSSINRKSLICMICGNNTIKYGLVIKKSQKNPSFFEQIIEIRHNSTICFGMASLENPNQNLFACIETSHDKPYDKYLVFYSLNLLKNSVKRKVFIRTNPSSYLLIPIPEEISLEGGVIIVSRGILTLIEYENKKIKVKPLPWQKTCFGKRHPLISCFDYYRGVSKVLLIMITEEGCILKSIFHCLKKNFRDKWNKMEIKYFSSLPGAAKSVKILANGFLFVSMEEGNHLHFHFMHLGKKKTKRLYFSPELRTKNLFLIDEFVSVSPIVAIRKQDLFNRGNKQLILLCGSKSRSSVRILQKTSGVDLIREKNLQKKPIGVNIIKNDSIFIHIIFSFQKTTASFSLNRNIEEINNNGLIIDCSTFSTEFLKSRKGVFQSTNKKIRFIKYRGLKRKIIQWEPNEGSLISNSTILEVKEVLILLILSNWKVSVIKLEKNFFFLEVGRLMLENPYLDFLFGVKIQKKNKISNFKYFVILSKKERSSRTFFIRSDFSLKLVNVQLLPWCPETGKLLLIDKKINLIISLNNGTLFQSQLDSKNARVESIRIIKICSSPVFISDGDFDSKTLIFGPKIWKFDFISKQICCKNWFLNQCFDLVEPFDKLIFLIKGKNMKILLGKRIHSKFNISSRINFNFTPIDIGHISISRNSKVTIIVHSDNYSDSPFHQMNLLDEFPSKKKIKTLVKKPEGVWISGLSLLSIKKKSPHKIKGEVLDFFLINGATKERSISSVLFVKSIKKKFDLILICFKNFGKLTDKKKPFILIEETLTLSVSLGIFIIKKGSRFLFELGGRKQNRFMARLVFEKPFFLMNDSHPISYIEKCLFGGRILFSQNGLINFLEIKKKKFTVISKILCPSFSLCIISTMGNRVVLVDPGEGIKIFVFSEKSNTFNLAGEFIQLKYLNLCKLIDPFSLIVGDQFGTVFFLRFIESKKKGKFSDFSILFQIEIKSPVRGIFVFPREKNLTCTNFILVTVDGLILEIEQDVAQKKIINLFLSLFFSSPIQSPTQIYLLQSAAYSLYSNKDYIQENLLWRFRCLIKRIFFKKNHKNHKNFLIFD